MNAECIQAIGYFNPVEVLGDLDQMQANHAYPWGARTTIFLRGGPAQALTKTNRPPRQP